MKFGPGQTPSTKLSPIKCYLENKAQTIMCYIDRFAVSLCLATEHIDYSISDAIIFARYHLSVISKQIENCVVKVRTKYRCGSSHSDYSLDNAIARIRMKPVVMTTNLEVTSAYGRIRSIMRTMHGDININNAMVKCGYIVRVEDWAAMTIGEISSKTIGELCYIEI